MSHDDSFVVRASVRFLFADSPHVGRFHLTLLRRREASRDIALNARMPHNLGTWQVECPETTEGAPT